MLDVVHEWIQAGVQYVGIAREVVVGVEQIGAAQLQIRPDVPEVPASSAGRAKNRTVRTNASGGSSPDRSHPECQELRLLGQRLVTDRSSVDRLRAARTARK